MVGAGTRQIRIGDAKGIFGVMYVAKFEEAVYVLHCFQKKTQATNPVGVAPARIGCREPEDCEVHDRHLGRDAQPRGQARTSRGGLKAARPRVRRRQADASSISR